MAVLLVLAARPAAAGNGLHPRTPVVWPEDTPCMTVIDRSQSAMVHFPYTIPYEDTDATMDEVPDSRRHQFVAFCRNHSPQDPLPGWLSWKDVGAAVTAGLIKMTDVYDKDVMEMNTTYKDCFWRITPDDARRPITFAEAMKGVDWDTTGLAAGPYIVQGYTWEPAFNKWSKRPGVFHVVDGPDLSAVAPALAVTNLEDVIFGSDTLTLTGCVRAMPGSKLSGFWSLTTGDTLDWQPFAQDVAFMGETWEMPYTPEMAAVGQTVALRVDVTDPMQRTFAAFPLQLLTVIPGGGGTTTGCDTGSIIGSGSCGGSTDGSGETSTGASSSGGPGSGPGSSSSGAASDSATSGQIDPTEPGTCGCGAGGDVGGAAGWLLFFGLVRRRKRGSTLARL